MPLTDGDAEIRGRKIEWNEYVVDRTQEKRQTVKLDNRSEWT